MKKNPNWLIAVLLALLLCCPIAIFAFPQGEFFAPDLNHDGKTDILDAILLSEAIREGSTEQSFDYNGDTNVDVLDLVDFLFDIGLGQTTPPETTYAPYKPGDNETPIIPFL